MSRNIEIKAHVCNPEILRRKVEESCDRCEGVLFQKDIFYNIDRLRIKLRNVNGHSELIIYRREDTIGPKQSNYMRIPIAFPKFIHGLLRATFGVRGIVEKKRSLFFSGNTRIHLDEVNNLGNFIEFEVVLDSRETPAEGIKTANQLLDFFEIKKESLIAGSYIDLAEKQRDCPVGSS